MVLYWAVMWAVLRCLDVVCIMKSYQKENTESWVNQDKILGQSTPPGMRQVCVSIQKMFDPKYYIYLRNKFLKD